MKKNLKILGVEDTKDGRPKVTSTGKKFARINTEDSSGEQKWMNCFSMVAVEEMKKLLNKNAWLEVIESGEYLNISKCYGIAETLDDEVNPEVIKMSTKKVEEKMSPKEREFHLSVEEVRCRALECAIKIRATTTMDADKTMFEVANEIVDWINQI